jgi:hypothetical protein
MTSFAFAPIVILVSVVIALAQPLIPTTHASTYVGSFRSAELLEATRLLPAATVFPETDQFPIDVILVAAGEESGEPYQIVEIGLRGGATLSDASAVVYGSESEVDAIFAAVQAAHPNITNPGLVPAGLRFPMRINPTSTFVLYEAYDDPSTGARVREYTNGAIEHVFVTPRNGVRRLVKFPLEGERPFVLMDRSERLEIQPGGRLIDYEYDGSSFDAMVESGFEIASVPAASEFNSQTGWDPTEWPPPAGEQRRVVTGPDSVYVEAPPPPIQLTATDERARAHQRSLIERQQAAGIYVERHEALGTIYHVAVRDPRLTASDVARLIYGSSDAPADGAATWQHVVAKKAGFFPPVENAARLAAFDPRLFGRSFELFVNAVDEQFVVDERTDETGRHIRLLANGTTVETSEHPDQGGVMQLVRYPSGYKHIVYKPGRFTKLAADLVTFFRGGGIAFDEAEESDPHRDRLFAQAIWHLAPDMPREPGDLADDMTVENRDSGTVVRVVVGPRASRGVIGDFVARIWEGNPLIAAVILILVGTSAVIGVRIHTHRGRTFA